MDEVIELHKNVRNVCRLCLSSDAPKTSIFGDEKSASPLVVKIQVCLSIKVAITDKLSTQICNNCISVVSKWYDYKQSCLKSQETLNSWLGDEQHPTPTHVVTVKEEPVDYNISDDVEIASVTAKTTEIIPLDSPSDNTKNISQLNQVINESEKDIDKQQIDSMISETVGLSNIKTEPIDESDTDYTIEIESVTSNYFDDKTDNVVEADSTQKFNTGSEVKRRKYRQEAQPHRAPRIFKQKCSDCQIFLHSKRSFTRHMEKYHGKLYNFEVDETRIEDDEESVEDLEAELVNMEQETSLTQVQQNIISQLKTFSCYACQKTFDDRRSTLNHIRQHMPDLRPHTCIACLTEFPDRSMYKLHCTASFECAMKIALVVPNHGEEKYFTCNMCLQPLLNRKELLSHLSKHSDKQYEELMSPSRSPPKLNTSSSRSSSKDNSLNATVNSTFKGPFNDGDPVYNNLCELCGMIYKHKSNLEKHKELCEKLEPEIRTCYKCNHCGKTFLVFKKLQNHVVTEHGTKSIGCVICNISFTLAKDYLNHHEEHRQSRLQGMGSQSMISNSKNKISEILSETAIEVSSLNDTSEEIHKCALCGDVFSSKLELTEHRNLHLKVKIYSCVICRSMFSSAGALEVHMKDHGIEDPNERNANISCVEYGQSEDESESEILNSTEQSDQASQKNSCNLCNRVFSNYANLRRHMRNVHEGKTRFPCSLCPKVFKSMYQFENHSKYVHKTTKQPLKCPHCPKTFVFAANLQHHFQNTHGQYQPEYTCDICGKKCSDELPLKIHRSWHFRNNYRYNNISLSTKSSSPARQVRAPSTKNFLCRVCNRQFHDVETLRKHLWDVHCARHKQEKSLSDNELQCALCTYVFPDSKSLETHLQWHKANPILSDSQKTEYYCDVCGKCYSSKKVLWKHKKLHKATMASSIQLHSLMRKQQQYTCTICHKVFGSNRSLQRHKVNFHTDLNYNRTQVLGNSTPLNSEDETKITSETRTGRKPVKCHVCRKVFANMSVLYKHKQIVHKVRNMAGKQQNEMIAVPGPNGRVSCNICRKQFRALSHLKQHFSLMHKLGGRFYNRRAANVQREMNVHLAPAPSSTSNSLTAIATNPSTTLPVKTKKPDLNSSNMIIYTCTLCKRHVFNYTSIIKHMMIDHKIKYPQENGNELHKETDLCNYSVDGAENTTCPICKIKYPNNRALKIHYFKVHDYGTIV